MKLTLGSRWMSAVCATEIVVVKAPPAELALECGGAPMVAIGSTRPPGAAPAPDRSGGTLLGKRYADSTRRVELLCTKGGQGSLALDGAALAILATTPLPSSD
ncbi:MAG TPA: hypothetical protein VLX90_19685 [Steroidobacteraceae bacterium]|nr:hypothetical protein [Steroidobacteraceae bacterium]